jgi:hypothetical protein
MIISQSKRFIFAAFNKTGTTSVESALEPYGTWWLHHWLHLRYKRKFPAGPMFKHARPADIKSLIGEGKWDNFFTFTFVRNPWSRAVSLYHFHRKSLGRGRWQLAACSFDDWVRGGGTGTAKVSMAKFVQDDIGRLIVKFVGRFERLDEDFATVCDTVGVKRIKLPHLNRSTADDYRQYYSAETRDIVADWCREDIDAFGYDF